MNLLKAVMTCNCARQSPIAISLRSETETTIKQIQAASANCDKHDDSGVLTFILDKQLFCWDGGQLKEVNWDGRKNSNANTNSEDVGILKVVPFDCVRLDTESRHLLIPAVAVADFKPFGPMLYHNPETGRFPVDKRGITTGTPVTLLLNTAFRRITILDYGPYEQLTRMATLPELIDSVPDEAMPACLTPLMSIEDLPIDWGDEEETNGSGAAPQKAGSVPKP